MEGFAGRDSGAGAELVRDVDEGPGLGVAGAAAEGCVDQNLMGSVITVFGGIFGGFVGTGTRVGVGVLVKGVVLALWTEAEGCTV